MTHNITQVVIPGTELKSHMKKVLLLLYLLYMAVILFGLWWGVTQIHLSKEVSLVTVFSHPLWMRAGLGFGLILITGILMGRQLVKEIKGKTLTIAAILKYASLWLAPVLLVLVLNGMINWYVAIDLRLAQVRAGTGPLVVKEISLTAGEDGVCFESIRRKGSRLEVNNEIFTLRLLPLPVDTNYIAVLEGMTCW